MAFGMELGPVWSEQLLAVRAERRRQVELQAAGRFKYTCADGELSDAERLAVLAEEFGEVAREVAEGVAGNGVDLDALRKELIQVAAVAVAWAEWIDRRKASGG